MKLNPDIVWRDQDENVLVFDPADGKIYKTNKSGAIVWKLLEKPEEEIVAELMKIFDVDEEAATASVREFVEKVGTIGFVEE
ncbi:MAG: PqqD family protein [Theionarchaea archaeon]|nr:PqqD family protein [Theionarchaea archaeon]MBU6999352.1 PqqD family protein [Theionarchaea archaeon]MBU7021812.1 PqqD family protein [Theionarchaea archaeon]MBU7034143.1 PqqD family protein [Theionarchaea archaeon]MBU7040021.1 PqqD family protein [Theionarchaea archaeon]